MEPLLNSICLTNQPETQVETSSILNFTSNTHLLLIYQLLAITVHFLDYLTVMRCVSAR